MIFAKKAPWEKLGRQFDNEVSLQEAMEAAGLTWKVSTEPLFTEAQERVTAQITRRDDNNAILGVVGPAYKPLQNSEAFNFFQPFINMGEASVRNAGSIYQGRKVFVLAKINKDPMVITGDDTADKFILLANSHDGTMAVKATFCGVSNLRNTMIAGNPNSESRMSLRHSKNVSKNLEEIQKVMDMADAQFLKSVESYRLLASRQIDRAELEKYVKMVFTTDKKLLESESLEQVSAKRILEVVVPLFEAETSLASKGTLWAAYNAVAQYLQNYRGEDESSRLSSFWFGDSQKLNRRALEKAIKLL